MRHAVKMSDTATYRTERATGTLRHVRFKEQLAVRAHRIKMLEPTSARSEKQEAECG